MDSRLQRYWEGLHAQGSAIEGEDEDLLQVVCHPGAPTWHNRFVDLVQRDEFHRAMGHVGPVARRTGLEIGCGSGRWSRVLRDEGANLTAIDISATAIERNRRLIPGVSFLAGDIMETDFPEDAFDLAVSVTVIQHLPPDGQEQLAARLSRVLRPGGRMMIMENIRDHAPHVYARSISGWKQLFEGAGFTLEWVDGYEYEFPLRLLQSTYSGLKSRRHGTRSVPGPIEVPQVRRRGGGAGMKGSARRFAREAGYRLAVSLSRTIEAPSRALPDRLATHVAMVFCR